MKRTLRDIREVALMTGYSVSALQKFRAIGKGPKCVRRGREFWYERDDVQEWIFHNKKGGEV
jgi:predicted DNA-binding transcriptional regulator AlpA